MNPPPGAVGPKSGPAFQVVGFHVEGAFNSPVISTLDGPDVGASSPVPVIIPPSFQNTAPAKAAVDGGSAMLQEPAASVSIGGAILPSQGTQGSVDTQRGVSEGGLALTSAEGIVSETSITTKGTGQLPPSSMPKMIHDAARSEAIHAGILKPAEELSASYTSEISTMSTLSGQMSMGTAAHTQEFSSSTMMRETNPAHAPSHPSHHKHLAAPPPAAPELQGSDATSASGHPQGPTSGKAVLSRAERRAVQEAQRAAKAASKAGGPQTSKAGAEAAAAKTGKTPAGGSEAGAAGAKGKERPPPPSSAAKLETQRQDSGLSNIIPTSEGHAALKPSLSVKKTGTGRGGVSLASAEMFSHLQQYKKVSVSMLCSQHKDTSAIHPAVLQLGLQYADGSISGANARCVAMMHTLCQVIEDYVTPDGKSLSRDLTQQINTIITFLVECRTLSVSMGNAIKFVKLKLSKVDPSKPEVNAKADLIQDISDYINARIYIADSYIVAAAVNKVVDGDVILTFAYSHVVAAVLKEAAMRNTDFRVVVVDARPENEGRQMLQKLLEAGVSCTYIHLTAISYAMREVTKVFLGAAAVMSNGTVMGRAGSASVAMVAHDLSKPVMICCESYKFHERVQLDSITHNELGDPDALASVTGRPDITTVSLVGQDQTRMGLLNLKYDAMPAEYVTMIVTEFGSIPPTSVPVILRERQET
ncbi:hypothetical protein CEUSTIGMA_g9610.t1 [Chlamydomonas eustigma]|uniref:Translation initiation factor eIF2B subunit delta n=1 Tax=Chlamydomonas eustigma TaxID=1157962 RepID=A0A250XGY7_9CHLO|nr:hypothetical protein CEUSTIGMA_g9610.t1 [Chlamydomonas eustigma]|eukprot:GAX82182.1 hypothetical protein CEUSTIGMA_g9610.t1 [Chlamydomonas eustigma]